MFVNYILLIVANWTSRNHPSSNLIIYIWLKVFLCISKCSKNSERKLNLKIPTWASNSFITIVTKWLIHPYVYSTPVLYYMSMFGSTPLLHYLQFFWLLLHLFLFPPDFSFLFTQLLLVMFTVRLSLLYLNLGQPKFILPTQNKKFSHQHIHIKINTL